jgi:hypothetical protein
MQVGPTSDFGAYMYSIHFLNILYHYTCATRAHQWGKRSSATHKGQFCRWRASINPRFASAINYRSRWGWKNPLNSCTSCNSCKARKSSNPVARSLQPPYNNHIVVFHPTLDVENIFFNVVVLGKSHANENIIYSYIYLNERI